MTAEPTPAAAWMSYLDRQRRADQTIENVLSLPDDAPRVELRDGTRRRDRFEKPADYAAARIPHFWRVEQNPVHVFAYELAGDRYELVADSGIELTLEKPFEIRLPIGEITP